MEALLSTDQLVNDTIKHLNEITQQRDTLHRFITKLILLRDNEDRFHQILDDAIEYLRDEY